MSPNSIPWNAVHWTVAATARRTMGKLANENDAAPVFMPVSASLDPGLGTQDRPNVALRRHGVDGARVMEALADDEDRPSLHLLVDPAEILRDDAEEDELDC